MGLLKLDFLAGYKTYVILGVGVALTWIGYFTGTDIICEIEKAGNCVAPDLGSAVNKTWAALAGITIRKGLGK